MINSKQQAAIAANIKKARSNSGLTQAQLADKADLNKNYYARLERGDSLPSLDSLYRITKALKIESSDILPF